MLVLFLLAGFAPAAPAPIDLQADLGFGGWIVPGVWTPLRIEITTSAAVEGQLVITTGLNRPSASWQYPIRLGAGARQRVDLSVLIDDPRHPVVLSVMQQDRPVLRRTIPISALRAAEGIVVALTQEAAGLEIVADLPQRLRPAYLREPQLPTRWHDYEGVALAVLRDLDDSRVLPAQREALIQWVVQGGRLLVAGGTSEALHASWLRGLLPATPGVGTRQAVLKALAGTARPVPVVEITSRPGADRIVEQGTVVAARWTYGRGVVTVWAFDPLASEVRAWPRRRDLWASVLEARPRPPVAGIELGRVLPVSQSLPGRAQLGLATLTVLYIFAVRYSQQRWVPMRGGWLSLAAVALIFGGLMYAFAVTARGSTVAATQVSVIETLRSLRFARAVTYVSVVNPYGGTYRLRGPEGAAVRSVDRIPTTFLAASNYLQASETGRGHLFESLQVVAQGATARLTEDLGAPQLIIHTDPAITVSAPTLFISGRVYPLPDFTQQLQLLLDPARWEALDARGPIPQDLPSQIRYALYTRLRETDSLRDRLWLVGWITDPRLRVMLDGMSDQRGMQLLVAEVARR